MKTFTAENVPLDWYIKLERHFKNALEIDSKTEGLSPEYFKKDMSFFFLEENGNPVAMAVIEENESYSLDEDLNKSSFFDKLVSIKKGAGAKLMEEVLNMYQEKYIELFPAEEWLVPYYEKFGFVAVKDELGDVDYMIKTPCN
jgi:hypothetical protein